MSKLNNPYVISVVSKLHMVILGFLNSILISRYLGPELLGQYSYVINFVNILSLVLTLSIGQSYPYFKKQYGEEIKGKFINLIYIQMILYLLIVLTIIISNVSGTIKLILLISILTQFNSQIGFISLIVDLVKKNLITIYTSFINTSLLLLVFFTSSKNLGFIFFILIFNLVLNSLWLIIKIKIIPSSLKIELELLKKIFIFAIFPMMTSLLIMLNYNLDIIILERFVGFEEIGIYSIGVTLAKMLWIIPDAFKDVLFNKTASKDSINDIKFSIKFNVLLSIIIIIGFSIFGNIFINLTYGEEFSNAFEISLILFLGSIPMIFFKMINTLYIAVGKQRFSFVVLLCAVIANIGLNYLFIPLFGLYGASITTIITYSFSGFIFLFSFKRDYNVSLKDLFLINSSEINKFKILIRKMGGRK